MFRCLKPGCPDTCGTHHRPSCADRLLYYVLLIAFCIALAASFYTGVMRIHETRDDLSSTLPTAGFVNVK